MKIALLLYDGLTTLDIVGPYETLCRLPGVDLVFVAKTAGEVRVDTGRLGLVADHALADVANPDVVVVPGGGRGTLAAAADAEILDWLRAAHEGTRFTTSVCTGALVLGAAGLLEGLRATTHWAAREMLDGYGARYQEERIVREGRIMTAAGVSAGIDMGLLLAAELAGEDVAKATQLAIEYDPQPPFDCGSRAKASDEIVALALAALSEDQ